MQVHPSQLKPGCLLIEDVMGNTLKPIIPRNTVIQPLHIEVLQAFLIEEVEVSTRLANGDKFEPNQKVQKNEEEIKKEGVLDLYFHSVNKTREMFKHWQGGKSIDIQAVRNHFVPLVKAALKSPEVIFSFYHYAEKEQYFYHHAVTVGIICSFLGKQLNLSEGDQIQVGLAGYFSDCGMAKIEPNLLKKEKSFTIEELEIVKKHPVYSYRMIEHITALKKEVKLAVLQHHERLDGSGYPFQMDQNQIHLYSKIVSVADVFHAMTCERSYKRKKSPFKVIEEMLHEEFGKLDLIVMQTLIKHLTNYSLGTKVKLSNSLLGEIVYIDSHAPTRPMVQLDYNKELVALGEHTDLYIEEILL
nr:HD-GYP domain-containing protein [Salirhabdus salicampi]